ncbi:hypothetical protein [Pseudonocardia acaciae]|uniref:hypothetical protein n=1 Tax=Pseudonocardia acaciae TaxID=551276 RepID=UPI0012ED0B29|nr:hypothetical protein [Pseudonocardia acaciae]
MFFVVPVTVFVPALLRKLDDTLLGLACGHRAAWPVGDPLLECTDPADDDVPSTTHGA